MPRVELTSVGRKSLSSKVTSRSLVSELMRALTFVSADNKIGGDNTRKVESLGIQQFVQMPIEVPSPTCHQ